MLLKYYKRSSKDLRSTRNYK